MTKDTDTSEIKVWVTFRGKGSQLAEGQVEGHGGTTKWVLHKGSYKCQLGPHCQLHKTGFYHDWFFSILFRMHLCVYFCFASPISLSGDVIPIYRTQVIIILKFNIIEKCSLTDTTLIYNIFSVVHASFLVLEYYINWICAVLMNDKKFSVSWCNH